LIVWGAQDHVVPPADALATRAGFPVPSSRSSTAAGTCPWPSGRCASTGCSRGSWLGSSRRAVVRVVPVADQGAALAIHVGLVDDQRPGKEGHVDHGREGRDL